MKSKKTLLGILITVIAFGTFCAIFVRAFLYYPQDELSESALPANIQNDNLKQGGEAIAENYPLRLNIPVLKINAKVQKVGITTKGNMAAPSNYTDVGWYKYGSVPGQAGNAVMAGHVDNGIAFPGVFKHLGGLKAGDDIYVDMSDDKKIHYVVTGISIYDYDDKLEAVYSNESEHSLKLITCTGRVLLSKRTHAERLVVTAVEVKG